MSRELRSLTSGVDRYVLVADRGKPEPRPTFLLRPPTFDEMAQIVNLREGEIHPATRSVSHPNNGARIAYSVRTCLIGWEGMTVRGAAVPFVGAGRVQLGAEPRSAATEDLDHLDWSTAEELAERVMALMAVSEPGLS